MEAALQSLKQGKLPKQPNYSLLAEKRKLKRSRLDNIKDNFESELRSVTTSGAPFTIESADLGPFYEYKNVLCGRSGQKLKFTVSYQSHITRPATGLILQKLGDQERTIRVFFGSQASYNLDVEKPIEEPQEIELYADIRLRRFIIASKVKGKKTVGLLDDSLKPESEYPVSGADNVKLDIEPEFTAGETKVYQEINIPDGISFNIEDVEFFSGIMIAEGNNYRVPVESCRVRLKYELINNTGTSIMAEHWGFPLSVLYEGEDKVSQVDVDVGVETKHIGDGQKANYDLSVTIPEWAYGNITLNHALSFYKRGMEIGQGGPQWMMKLGRVMLP